MNGLKVFTDEDLIKELELRDYTVYDNCMLKPLDTMLGKIELICRTLQPNGYIGKIEAKKIICDFLDYNMTSHF